LNLLLVRAGALGDILLLRKAVAGLRRAGHRVSLLAPPGPGSALLGSGPAEVESLMSWDTSEMASLLSDEGVPEGCLRERLRSFEGAIVYSSNQELRRNLGALVPATLAHSPAPRDGLHASEWLARGALPFAPVTPGPPPTLVPSREDRSAARAMLDRLPPGFIAIHPGSGSPTKNWPVGNFSALLEALEGPRPFLQVEGPAEEPWPETIDRVVARCLPPRVLGTVLSQAGLFVGNDSGVSHLAAAFGSRTIALFGPTDPASWAPLGPSVHVVRSRSGAMSGIEVAEVLQAVAATKKPLR